MWDKKFFADYRAFIKDTISKGYTKQSEKPAPVGRSWYIPHHGVYHPNKPGKIRVVFDCSTEFKGRSINHELMSRPDLTNQIVGVLLWFREEEVAFMADIEAMFYQVKIPPDQLSYLRFLWWTKSDINKEVIGFEMCTHVFGGTSSPSCSNFALKKTAIDNEKKFGEMAAATLKKNFYVDDLLKSMQNGDEACQLIADVINIYAKGGFNLTKFTSNKKEVLVKIPEEKRRKGVKNEDLMKGYIPGEKALDIQWSVDEDALMSEIKTIQKLSTRCGLLSTLSSIYDLLGLVSPFILEGRKIIQILCKNEFKWHEETPEDLRYTWLKWLDNSQGLEKLKVPWCYKRKQFGEIVDCSLHHFSDASETGYGQASYLRLLDNHSHIRCTLLMGKSRVAPLKYVSMPKMELTGATLSVKILTLLTRELTDYFESDVKETFWTDSQVVLGYIRNNLKRFKVFVANGVRKIRDHSDVSQWKYVKTSENPADFALRGLEVKQQDKVKKWFQGPEFLWTDKTIWSDANIDMEADNDDPELKKPGRVFLTKLEVHTVSQLTKMTSEWCKMRRIMALVILLIKKTQKRCHKKADINLCNLIDVKLLEETQSYIIKMSQNQLFHSEIDALRSSTKDISLAKSSSLYQLDPFIDENGLLRVGGRLGKSKLNRDAVHPVLLPKKNEITTAIFQWCYKTVAHDGRGLSLNQLRQSGFWVILGNSICRSIIHYCVTCLRLRGKLGIQKMADLPVDRMIEAPPFTYCGVDMFGRFIIKERHSEFKRYGILFTCLNSRAIHIEVGNFMDTNSFILALWRFIALRGNVTFMRSGSGSNFVGEAKELGQALKEMDKQVKLFLETQS